MIPGFLLQAGTTTTPPYLEIGAMALLAAIVLGVLRTAPLLVKNTIATMKAMATEFTAASKQARDDFRDERKMEREFMEKHFELNRASISGLERTMERATIATIASSKGVDVDEALETYENSNGVRSGR